MIDFRKIYCAPFYTDSYGSYIWTANDQMAFMNDDDRVDEKDIQPIVDKMNGFSADKFENIKKLDEETILINDKIRLVVRGFGHLTSSHGLNLNFEDAVQVQSDFITWTIDELKK